MPKKTAAKVFVSAGARFVREVVPAAVRPLHSLWHEIIGFLFIVIAVVIGAGGVRVARNFHGTMDELVRIVMAAVFVLLLGGYGVSSFLRARRISRS